MNNNDQITQILTIVLIVMVFIFMALAIAFIFFWLKSKKKKVETVEGKETLTSDAKKIAKEYTTESIFKFMEFEKIEDNMIVQKKGMRYIMVVECQGINYDLMSKNKKMKFLKNQGHHFLTHKDKNLIIRLKPAPHLNLQLKQT